MGASFIAIQILVCLLWLCIRTAVCSSDVGFLDVFVKKMIVFSSEIVLDKKRALHQQFCRCIRRCRSYVLVINPREHGNSPSLKSTNGSRNGIRVVYRFKNVKGVYVLCCAFEVMQILG